MPVPLSDLQEIIDRTHSGPVVLSILREATRFSLRVDPVNLKAVSQAFGLDIPSRIGDRVANGGREATCLGPDEWILTAPEEAREEVANAFKSIYGTAPHSLTDISDRDVTIEVSGKQAVELLSTSCPRDLRKIDDGTSTRTVFDSAEVVLHRNSNDSFRIDCWRSFVPHVWGLMNTANRELSIGL